MEEIAADWFEFRGENYHLVRDKSSGYMWCSRHKSQTTANSIEDIQRIINNFGPPDRVRTDNGPSYRRMFSKWLKKIGATHETTAPYTACSNGFIENGVKCTKGFL